MSKKGEKQMNYYAVGTYTTVQPHVPGACGKGIPVLEFNTETGELLEKTVIEGVSDPTYLGWLSGSRKLFAITESPEDEGRISSFRFGRSFSVSKEASVIGPGTSGCHLLVQPDISRIFAAAYAGGCMTGYRLTETGPEEPAYQFAYTGCGPDTSRQEAPHPHQVIISPDNQYLYVSDLGSDTIWMHKIDQNGDPSAEIPGLKMPSGCGPRHMAFSAKTDILFILCELMPRLITTRILENGTLEILYNQATVRVPEANPAAPAAIKIHPSGKTLAVSNRFQDTIAVFNIEKTDGSATATEPVLIDEFDCRGRTPRDIEFSPDGKWLLIANQDSDNIEIREFNPETGRAEDRWARGINTGTPVCLTLLEGLY